MVRPVLATAFLFALFAGSVALAQDRDTKVRGDKQQVTKEGFWIYDDLEKGIALAKQSKKPLLVVLRCIPCHACEGFDARVVDRDPEINELLEKFVCVRIVKGNALDLNLFQYDYDLSFAAFFMNADKTIYGRFGTRTKNVDPTSEISMEGFRKALVQAIEWHQDYPINKADFAGKSGGEVKFKVPEEYPSLKVKYKSELDYEGKVAQSCIHCHQIRDAERRLARESGTKLTDELLYPYPMPDVLGLKLDAKELATIKEVAKDSLADKAGLKAGDQLVSLNGQTLLSIADVQWALHNAKTPSDLAVKFARDGKASDVKISLKEGWRRADDITWRTTTWELRRMAAGGIKFDPVPEDQRAALKLEEGKLALLIKHLGAYGEHAAAMQAGFKQGDILVKYDGSTAPLTEQELLVAGMTKHKRGEQIPVTVVRGGKEVELKLPLQ